MADIVQFPRRKASTIQPGGASGAGPNGGAPLAEHAARMRADAQQLKAAADAMRSAVSDLLAADLAGQAHAIAATAAGEASVKR